MTVQTNMVSMNGSSPATTPSVTGSGVFTAAWAIGAVPRPDSLENRARFMPHRKALPIMPPVKAPAASVFENAETKIRRTRSGRSCACSTITYRPHST